MKKAFIYPGQGSQYIGMGVGVAEKFNIASDIFDRASDIIGYDMLELCANGPIEKLSETRYTQPAIFTVEAAITEVLKNSGIEPNCTAGHSLGEFASWYAAGVYSFEEGVSLMSERGRLMHGADPEGRGTMAAVIGLDYEVVKEACDAVEGMVVPANINSPGQVVISGEKEAVSKAGEILVGKGAKRFIPLNVSGAFHSPMMETIRGEFAEAVVKINFRDASIPVYSNVTATKVTSSAQIKELIVTQLTSPVRWIELVRSMAGDGVEKCYEIGPGNILAGMIKRIEENLPVESVSDDVRIMEVIDEKA